MTSPQSGFSRSERIYAFLLKFYPKSRRQEFGEEMQYVFSESLKDAWKENGRQGAARFWARIILDTGRSALVQHAESLSGGTSMKTIMMQNKNILFIALAVGLIMLIPLTAELVSEDFGWNRSDFIFASTFLFGTGLAFELIRRKSSRIEYRAGVGAALAGMLLLVWITGAVGIIGPESNPANLLYLGVIGVLLAGALVSLLRPRGMALALTATALAQAVITVIALIITPWGLDSFKAFVLNGFVIALWAGSAWLFWRAGQLEPAA
jgi:hypothetical protein